MNLIIDTHSHLNFKAYREDLSGVLKRTLDNNVWMINVGTKYETSKKAIEIAEKYGEGIFAAIGLHPIHIKTDLLKLKMDEDEGGFAPLGEEFDKEKYKELAKSKKVVAIGEIGLDYYYKPKSKTKLGEFKELQKKVFIEQLELAEELSLPVIIHCRMAFGDLYEILKNRKLKGVIHCFTGNLEEAQRYTDLGFYLGINGIIDKLDLTEVIKNIPLEKLLVETDCPYLTPLAAVALAKEAKIEGDKRNEPIFVKHIVQKIADLRGISFEEVASTTTQNAKNLFKI
jgi:TatD DNase family protein